MSKKYLFYIGQNYSFGILRPIQERILANGDSAAWFVEGHDVDDTLFEAGEQVLTSIEQAVDYDAYAVFVPGNVVPDFIPGIKVQVFHGLEYKKKGHFIIRGFFDVYCTHGPITTNKFNELNQKHKYFYVKETGWPKLDPYFALKNNSQENKSTKMKVLYAPTFSPRLTSAPALFERFQEISQNGDYQVTIKFHPKMDPELIAQYKTIASDHLVISTEDNILPLILSNDVLVSDTSSVIDEALLMGKRVITFNNRQPQNAIVNITNPDSLASSLDSILTNEQLGSDIKSYIAQVHPYQDGNSATRILDAVDEVAKQGLKRKPLNLVRKLKLRKKFNYFTFF
ncbi:CDP-glycerol glycerophosphotransferase family protein [Thalassotalea eurytherma]|uniref:CDP-glycerol--glycerophosphate glycerophosphotransferase n=1 Tax=Thalassotalea eurytherma TaxID=1144278 RepID=A0ABQ6H4H7_9GAMM|nr:CDP-glycerol glycerophosphotransferase family protein [Thalassotalea eurytherma]GLX82522.1 CDP-glycerol--glycerophosphate glycerophosphotransferase [Thalassotalea eurytherma]